MTKFRNCFGSKLFTCVTIMWYISWELLILAQEIESINFNLERVRMYIGSSYHTSLNEVIKPNSRIIDILKVSVVMKKIRYQRYDSRKHKLAKSKHKNTKNIKSLNLKEDKKRMHLHHSKWSWAMSFKVSDHWLH